MRNGRPWDGYYSGPRPLSEPENRAMRAFILRVKPALTIWYHQPLDEVYGSDPHVAVLKRYARLSGLPYRRLQAPRGAATRWERTRFPHGTHFVVEFPAGTDLGVHGETQRGRGAGACASLRRKLAPMLGVGEQIPDAQVWLGPREQVSLRDLAAEKPLLLLFYLFDWSST